MSIDENTLASSADTPASYNPGALAGPHEVAPGVTNSLRGNMGVLQLVFTVLSYNAPLSVMAGVAPLVIAFGVGVGAPLLFIVIGAFMMLFAVGYTAMSRSLPNPGAFYSYVAAGLGRALGLGASFVAVISYSIAMAGALVFTALALENTVHFTFFGPDVTWWVWALVFVVAIGVLGYLKVDISARVLGILLGVEIVIVLVWDAVVFGNKAGAGGVTFSSFDPSVMLAGSVVVGIIFAVSCFSGFEATAIFRDEVKNPEKTVPRATYLSIGIVTVFYALGTWALIQALGENSAVETIATSPTTAFFDSVGQYLGTAGYDIVTVLLVTSAFAALVAYHNVVSRYLFSLGADGVLPTAIGVPHPRLGSPHRASVILTIVSLLFVASTAAFSADPASTYTILVGIAGYTFIVLLTLAAVGIAVYLVRSRSANFSLWHRVIAPVSSAVLMIVVAVLATVNIDLLTGSAALSAIAMAIAFGSVLVGVIIALVLRATRPEVYSRIGRQ